MAAPDSPPAGRLALLGGIILLANAGLLVLQLLAGRYLAPFVGSSVETWTATIGVFLAGIALGNFLGGRLADARPSPKTLAVLLVLGAVSCLAPLAGMRLCQATGLHAAIPLGPRIPVLAAMFCLLPATILSMLTPLVIRLSLTDVRLAGRVAGLNFALSTVGCLAGNYLTGFVLMAHFTLDAISLAVAALVALLAIPASLIPPAGPMRTRDASEPVPPGYFTMRKAFAVVFVASFCGMTLELVGSRILAPIVGVSIYSWTGIIGVMLAGTACGNYLGGVLADRGPRAALRPGLVLVGFIAGFGGALPALAWLGGSHLIGVSGWGDWGLRFLGGLVGGAIVVTGIVASRYREGRLTLALGVGALLGYLLAGPAFRKLDALVRTGFDLVGIRPGWAEVPWAERVEGWDGRLAVAGTAIGLILGWMAWRYSRVDRGAERYRPAIPLATSLFFAALGTLLVVLSVIALRESQILGELGLVERVIAWTFFLFFLPMLLLGTVSPQVIRLAVPDVSRAGRSIGTIYAVSTLGAILGTFAAGYLLIDLVGTNKLILMTALVLTGLALYVGELWRTHVMLYSLSIVGSGAITGMIFIGGRADDPGTFTKESKYYSISVSQKVKNGQNIAVLTLDRLIHSEVDLDDPSFLHYQHEHVQAELSRWAYEIDPASEILVIGGGGYTFPRWVETAMPSLRVTVVEIDPAVTEMAYRHLNLPRETAIVTRNMDGRQFVAEVAPKGRYRLVMQDAVNDLSVPYHLLTREYNEAVARTLTGDGVYLLTLIDHLKTGELWKAAADTLRETFPHVHLLAPDARWDDPGDPRGVYVLYASMRPFDRAELRKAVEAASADRPGASRAIRPADDRRNKQADPDEIWTQRLADEELAALLRTRYRVETEPNAKGEPEDVIVEAGTRAPLILTDQKAPVDNLMGGTFRRRQ